ncbi:MAG: hypothetical protein HUJ29_01650 [Gammaproteobacteria bacterium]|nr:hypothetical protein [Gammaproteobacteria bacterium]
MDEEERTSAIGLARYSNEYYRAGKAADDVIGYDPGYEIHAPPPVMFLVAHSIELILKSYLREKGYTLKSLRKLSHGIYGCYEAALGEGLGDTLILDEEEEALLNLISDLHASTELKYIKSGYKQLPVFGPMDALAKKLLENISPLVGWRFRT